MLLNVLKNSDIKNKNRIGNRGDLYSIPVSVGIGLLLYPLNTILVMCPIKKAWTKLTIQSGKPFFFKIHRSLLYNILSKALLRSRLSINTIQPE